MTAEKGAAELRFKCTECGDCCRRNGAYAFVYLNDPEIDDLAAYFGLSRRSFMRRYTFVDEFGWRQLRFEDFHCPFLDGDSNRCTVYEARPIQCQTFPFWRQFVQDGKWTAEVRGMCEGIGEGEQWSVEYVTSKMAQMEAWEDE
jgi:hypothetical protein